MTYMCVFPTQPAQPKRPTYAALFLVRPGHHGLSRDGVGWPIDRTPITNHMMCLGLLCGPICDSKTEGVNTCSARDAQKWAGIDNIVTYRIV